MTCLPLDLARLAPAAHPLTQAWTLCTVGQLADAIINAAPGWTLPPIVSWSSAHMALALLTCGLLALATDRDGSGPTGLLASHAGRRLLFGALALLVVLLLGIVVLGQPTILLPALGLALTHRLWWAEALRPEAGA